MKVFDFSSSAFLFFTLIIGLGASQGEQTFSPVDPTFVPTELEAVFVSPVMPVIVQVCDPFTDDFGITCVIVKIHVNAPLEEDSDGVKVTITTPGGGTACTTVAVGTSFNWRFCDPNQTEDDFDIEIDVSPTESGPTVQPAEAVEFHQVNEWRFLGPSRAGSFALI